MPEIPTCPCGHLTHGYYGTPTGCLVDRCTQTPLCVCPGDICIGDTGNPDQHCAVCAALDPELDCPNDEGADR